LRKRRRNERVKRNSREERKGILEGKLSKKAGSTILDRGEEIQYIEGPVPWPRGKSSITKRRGKGSHRKKGIDDAG